MKALLPVLAVVISLVLLVGVAVASGAVSFADPPQQAAVAAVPPTPSAVPTLTADQIAAQSQLISEEPSMCFCGR